MRELMMRIPICAVIYGGLIFFISSCTVRNKFNTPKNIQEDTDKKRLIIFLASDVRRVRGAQYQKQWEPGCFLMAKPDNSNVLANLRFNGRRLFTTLIWEWNVIDTGNIKFTMAIKNGNRMMARKLFSDSTIHVNDLSPGDNYWHLNYYNERNKYGLIPVMALKEIDIENDFIIMPRRIRFHHFLTYDVSSDTATFLRNKKIISRQRTLHKRYNKIENEFKPVSLWLHAEQ
jgi:hypothetical protein